MADFIVGDLHGCFRPFMNVLEQAGFQPGRDTLWCVGDLIARGPDSAAVMDWCYQHQHCVRAALGNHDVHLLAIDAGIVSVKPKDGLDELLNHQQRGRWMHWLREQRFMYRLAGDQLVVCHAGIWPQWSLDQAEQLAGEVEQELRGSRYTDMLRRMYHNKPDRWSDALADIERLRFIINAFTRMRFVTSDMSMNLTAKMAPADAPDTLQPWFVQRQQLFAQEEIAFGHWASLMGDTQGLANIHALDTGCVWGNWLTLLRWQDRQLFTAPAS